MKSKAALALPRGPLPCDKLIHARCLYCSKRASIVCKAQLGGCFGSVYWHGKGWTKLGLLWRGFEKHYSGCCDKCSDAIDAGTKKTFAF